MKHLLLSLLPLLASLVAQASPVSGTYTAPFELAGGVQLPATELVVDKQGGFTLVEDFNQCSFEPIGTATRCTEMGPRQRDGRVTFVKSALGFDVYALSGQDTVELVVAPGKISPAVQLVERNSDGRVIYSRSLRRHDPRN